jgi:hypothetical protein
VTVNIHASCVAIGGKGVLILGESGSGKSDLALRLIDEGAKLVADDGCDLFVRAGKLSAAAPASIAGLIELRGIGIIALPHAKAVPVAMAVRLETRPGPRLPKPAYYVPKPSPGAHAKVPLIVVNASMASAGARIRTALRAFSSKSFRDTFNSV